MSHSSGSFFYTTENEIMVLCTVKFLSKSSNFIHDGFTGHKKMADIVIGSQKIQIKIRLEMWLEMFTEVSRDLILICINNIQLPVFIEFLYDLIESIRCQKIIMVKESYKFSSCHGKRRIGISRDSEILIQISDTDSPVSGTIFLKNSCHCGVLRTSICNTEFPVRIRLIKKRLDHLTQKNLRCTKCRYCDTDLRRIAKLVFLLLLKFCRIRDICLIPRTIRNFFRFKTLMQTNPEFFWTIMLQITESFLNCVGIQFLKHTPPLDSSHSLLFFIHILCPRTFYLHYFYS